MSKQNGACKIVFTVCSDCKLKWPECRYCVPYLHLLICSMANYFYEIVLIFAFKVTMHLQLLPVMNEAFDYSDHHKPFYSLLNYVWLDFTLQLPSVTISFNCNAKRKNISCQRILPSVNTVSEKYVKIQTVCYLLCFIFRLYLGNNQSRMLSFLIRNPLSIISVMTVRLKMQIYSLSLSNILTREWQ